LEYTAKLVVNAAPFFVMHHFLTYALPVLAGAAVASIFAVPEKVVPEEVVHETEGPVFTLLIVRTVLVAVRSLESVTVI
jgi:hypothetical protein